MKSQAIRLGMMAAGAALLLASCNNDAERIEELEHKIESLENQRATLAGSPLTAPSPAVSASAAPSPSATVQPAAAPSAKPDGGSPDPDGNICNDGRERYLTLANRGEETLMYFYASPPSVGDWEEDVLGDEVVSTGERFRVNFNTDERCTCTYDTRAVFADDSEVIREVSVCTEHTQTYP